jgi:hypothetical protein
MQENAATLGQWELLKPEGGDARDHRAGSREHQGERPLAIGGSLDFLFLFFRVKSYG